MSSIQLFEMSWKEYLEVKGFNKQQKETMSETCRKCKEDQLKRYKKITVKCTGEKTLANEIANKYGSEVSQMLLKELENDPEELLLSSSTYNPYDWMRANITDAKTFNPRWYQEKAVLCSARKKVLRMGRRCIEENEQVLMANGSYKKIKDVNIGDYVVSNRNNKVVHNRVTNVINNGVRSLYRIKTNDGKEVTLTSDHEVLTNNGWKSIDEGLKGGDFISHLPTADSTNTNQITEDEAISLRSKVVKYSDSNNFEFIKIKSITNLNIESTVYDLTVENDHNFVTNGLVVHNCGKTYSMVVGMLHKLLTIPGFIVLIAAPQITMIDEIVSACEEICRQLKTEYPIVSNSSSPIIEVRFNNGSVIKGVTTANDAKSARGKKADLIWLEEADFIETKAMNSILGVLADRPDIELWVSSTPIGERNLYTLSQQPDVKEFHFPTFVLPHYESENLDEFYRNTLSQTGYVQEIMAEYGVDVDSVFQIMFLEKSTDEERDPHYSPETVLANRNDYIIFIGTDWNHDKVGTRVVVSAYSKARGKLGIVEKSRVALVGWTQALAVELIVKLNRKYRSDHIYCDEGFGIGQVTELRKIGVESYGKVPNDHPDLKLAETVSVQFGSSIKINDQLTGEVYNKRVKQYMVENLANMLESNQLYFSSVEDNDIILQMKNYLIKNVSVTGAKSYTFRDRQIADHDLDAFMLTAYAFNVEYGDYIKPNAVEHVAGFGKEFIMEPALNLESIQEAIGMYINTNTRSKFKPRRKW